MAEVEISRTSKRCPKCDTEKMAGEFHRNRASHDGLHSECKECRRRHKREELRASATRFCPMCKSVLPKSSFAMRTSGGVRRLNGWCRACRRAEAARWAKDNPEKMRAAIDAWQARNPEKVKATRRKSNARMWTVPAHRLRCRIGGQIRRILAGQKRGLPTMELVGYTALELRAHLERQFLPGMSWSNMDRWHVDHIVPISAFTIESVEDPELRRAWALTNLRPLWATENLKKKDKRQFLI